MVIMPFRISSSGHKKLRTIVLIRYALLVRHFAVTLFRTPFLLSSTPLSIFFILTNVDHIR